MVNYKQVIIDALKRHHDNAMAKAKDLRMLAERGTPEESERLLVQAKEEEAKASRYLNHAEILSQTDV